MEKKHVFIMATILIITVMSFNKRSADHEAYKPIFKAVEMPNRLANGDTFPTDSTTINIWLSKPNVDENGVQNNSKIIGHSWGLWQALTEFTDQSYNGRRLRRYETWYTPQDVIKATLANIELHQLKRADIGNLQMRKKFSFGHDNELNTRAGDISGKVKYNPAMAQRALEERYFSPLVLRTKIIPDSITSVQFKPNSVMLKPIYRVLTKSNKVKGKNDLYYFNIWGGKKDGGIADTIPSGNGKVFSKKIYVNTNTRSPMISYSDGTPVYNIKNFIYHKMSKEEAVTYNNSTKEGQEFLRDSAIAGAPVILLGMHVSSRETRRWTWQSFYWTENPDNPVFPSSSIIAEGRNNLKPFLGFPENHYAVSIAYSMMSPALPYKSKNGEAIDINNPNITSVYGLNPYIEGTFTEAVFPQQNALYTGDYAKQYRPINQDGITSNCMSCHSQSFYSPNNNTIGQAVGNFVADQYVNRDAPWFKGGVQLDFAWSLFPMFEPMPSKD